VRITGRIDNAEDALLLCEQMRYSKHKIVDTARLTASGKFKFYFDMAQSGQDFFQLSIDSQPSVLLLLSAGEQPQITADATDFAATIEVTGCAECNDMLLLQKTLLTNSRRIDSVLQLNVDQPTKQRLASKIFVEQKRFNTAFIINHLGALSSAAAYYQKLNQSLALFGYVDDRFLLAKMVDTLRRSHPKSPYTQALERDLEKLDKEASLRLLQEKINATPTLDKPEIALPDINGKVQRLSSLVGNVTLLHFWSARQTSNQLDNRELLNLHKDFAGRGFKIYQVAVDSDSATWRNAVREQGLSWINVLCAGEGCKAALVYNVTALPSNFLLNKKGEVVGKNLFDKDLRSKVVQLLAQ
jgi:peroxiredoxin